MDNSNNIRNNIIREVNNIPHIYNYLLYNNYLNSVLNNINNNDKIYNLNNCNWFNYNNNDNIFNNISQYINNNGYNNYNLCTINRFIINNLNNYNIINQIKNNNFYYNQKYLNQINYQKKINNIGVNIININNIKNINNNNQNKNICNSINNKNENSKNNTVNHKEIIKRNQFNLDEFIQYINTLPMTLANYLCSSKGIAEIQKYLPKSNCDYKLFIVLHLNKGGIIQLMKNTYGNYFFQQIIKDSNKKIISLILSYISDEFINVCKDSSGTFSLQALLDQITTKEEEQIILKYIKNNEMDMAYDKNATHVLQKLILLFPDNSRIELNKIILDNIINLCLDSNGICLIKNFIKTNTLLDDRKKINEEFVKNFVILAENPFGNYGIQYLLENWDINLLNDIKDKIMDNIYKLSLQQYSSNVVEKAIEIFDGEYREQIIQKLYFQGKFLILLNNKFGRFVLYKSANFMNAKIKHDFENKINENINNNIYRIQDKNKIQRFLLKINNKKKNINYESR